MIFANSSWGKLMHECGVPGIYRAQGGGNGWATRLQVRMQTHAAPHQGLGVDQYAWSTSPLRRYTDLVNQWQIMACVSHTVTAPLVAPFKPKDADLFAIVSAFDGAYAAYADFQNTMERYWCLRWLKQESQRIVDAVVLKDQMLRLTEIPLVIQMSSLPTLARGAQVKLELLDGDEVDLSVQARLVEVVSTESALDANALSDGEVEEESSEGEQTTLSATTEVVEPSPANTE
jgi:exoribonuclease-2